MKKINAIILAAGKGSRMKTKLSKVLHKVAGKAIVSHVVSSLEKININQIFMVVGYQGEQVREHFSNSKLTFVDQTEQLGTGHAVKQVQAEYNEFDSDVIVLAGDCPLITEDTLQQLINAQHEANAAATVLTTKLEDPARYGRIIRSTTGSLTGIVEAKDCTKEQLLVNEINTGAYIFKSTLLFDCLDKLTTNNKSQEYYLTDVIAILKDQGERVDAFCTPHSDQVLGINTRQDLATINQILYKRNNQRFMDNGVTIIDPSTTFIDSTVSIGEDTVVYPFTSILGDTVIGKNCTISPNTFIFNSSLTDEHVTKPNQSIGVELFEQSQHVTSVHQSA